MTINKPRPTAIGLVTLAGFLALIQGVTAIASIVNAYHGQYDAALFYLVALIAIRVDAGRRTEALLARLDNKSGD